MLLFVVFERHLSFYKPQTKHPPHPSPLPLHTANKLPPAVAQAKSSWKLSVLLHEPRMKMILYTGIQNNSNYSINILHCILIKTEMHYCIALVLFIFLNINFCVLVTIKLNVSLVCFFIWYMVFNPVRSSPG